MKTVLLIGMGKFGQTLGQTLINMGDDVMIVDKDEDVINSLAPKYANALIANCMNADNLKAMDIPSFDVCIVAISDDFQSSLEDMKWNRMYRPCSPRGLNGNFPP